MLVCVFLESKWNIASSQENSEIFKHTNAYSEEILNLIFSEEGLHLICLELFFQFVIINYLSKHFTNFYW